MTCLADSQIQRFFERTLSPEQNAAVEKHVDECAQCRKLLRDVAAGLPAQTPEKTLQSFSKEENKTPLDKSSSPDVPPLKPGTLVEDRYVVLELIGMGGMGRVYAAYDRELDRKVALKLLRHEQGDGALRLVQEARSLAKLSHPNVVVVHDIGTTSGQAYMAMEYVEGRTLRQWLAEEKPRFESILHTYLEAAKGLSAAHAAGLIHRDFKPDNVILSQDGRVRVTDFGLARASFVPSPSDAASHDVSVTGENAKAAEITRLEGTLLYIAPERFASKPSDAKGDQFAFSVAFYEALYGEYPYTFHSIAELPKILQSGVVRPAPKRSRVPSRVRAVVLRGLAADPDMRFPNLDLFSAALRSAHRRTQIVRYAAPMLVVSLGLIGTASAFLPKDSPPALCQGAEIQVNEVWNVSRKEHVKKALLDSKLPYAENTWRTVESSMDRYAERWATAHKEACMATRVYGEQSEAVLDRRTACLSAQLAQFAALSQALGEVGSDGKTDAVSKAAEATQKLNDPALCKSLEVLQDQMMPPQTENAAVQVRALRGRLAYVEAQNGLGRGQAVREEAQAISNEADRLAYGPLQAESGFLLAMVSRGQKTPAEMRQTLERSLIAAESGNDERATLRIWLDLANFSIWKDARLDEAEKYLKHAEAYLQRMNGDLERLRLLTYRSALYRAQSLPAEAFQAAQLAVAHAEAVFGSDSIHTASALMELGINAHLAKQPEPSRKAFRRAIEIAERVLGDTHPAVASICMNYGHVLFEQDPKQSEEYLKVLKHAAEIAELSGGDIFGQASDALSRAMLASGHDEEALRYQDHAKAINEPTLGAFHPDRVRSLLIEVAALSGLHRDAEASTALLKAYDIAERGDKAEEMTKFVIEQGSIILQECDNKSCKEMRRTLTRLKPGKEMRP